KPTRYAPDAWRWRATGYTLFTDWGEFAAVDAAGRPSWREKLPEYPFRHPKWGPPAPFLDRELGRTYLDQEGRGYFLEGYRHPEGPLRMTLSVWAVDPATGKVRGATELDGTVSFPDEGLTAFTVRSDGRLVLALRSHDARTSRTDYAVCEFD